MRIYVDFTSKLTFKVSMKNISKYISKIRQFWQFRYVLSENTRFVEFFF